MSGFSAAAVTVEDWLAAGYCVALVGLAYVIDGLARRAASIAEGGPAGGFVYHRDHDAWQCPQDQWLWPQSFDARNRVMRYRGTPSVCNACPVKAGCTTSASGREVHRLVDSWPASEAARFHRGIACVVVVLGLVWPLGTALTGPGPDALLVLVGAMAAALLLSLPLWSHLRRIPVFIPEGVRHRSHDDAAAERAAAAAAAQRRRASYGSDRRGPGAIR
ncbi:hypothetical protein GCM10020358_61610 [Amorphoplanes nipponensis]|uniref:Transposase DDE domain-containing protein n=1 Tax=Actinoplanes nipponensis TaxID=135950 RepID=A0A919JVW7_9ACTN|nr:hypothetical protein [Actinoplanes nipponensis]GIE53964.1 hypothetical protein Ani05nite_74980 [Actinoplanes nipponensis]